MKKSIKVISFSTFHYLLFSFHCRMKPIKWLAFAIYGRVPPFAVRRARNFAMEALRGCGGVGGRKIWRRLSNMLVLNHVNHVLPVVFQSIFL